MLAVSFAWLLFGPVHELTPLVSPQGASTLRRIEIRNEDGIAVSGNIFVVPATGGPERRLGATNESGVITFIPPEILYRGDQIVVYPHNDFRYYNSDQTDVSNRMTFVLMRRPDPNGRDPRTRDIIHLASQPTTADELLLLYNEVAQRTGSLEPDFARVAERRVYIEAGRLLDVRTPITYDIHQAKHVASSELRRSIVDFQGTRGLSPDGILGFQTIKALLKNRAYWQVSFGLETGVSQPDDAHGPTLPSDFLSRIDQLNDPILSSLASNALNTSSMDVPSPDGLRALLFSELATRLAIHESTPSLRLLAQLAKLEVYRALGREFSVEPITFDRLQQQFVMTSSLVAEVTYFQLEAGLPPNGASDYTTLRHLAQRDVAPYLVAGLAEYR